MRVARLVLIIILLIGGSLGAGYYIWRAIPIRHPAGQIAPGQPIQRPLSQPLEPFDHKGFSIAPIAEFFVTARVLAKRAYYDETASISPIDLALGWDCMSDQSVLDKLRISQTYRFFFYEYQLPPPAPKEELQRSSSNMHLIPADDTIKSRIAGLRVGEIVDFGGYLVNVSRQTDALRWNSSTVRTDEGKGACEIVWISSLQVVSPKKVK